MKRARSTALIGPALLCNVGGAKRTEAPPVKPQTGSARGTAELQTGIGWTRANAASGSGALRAGTSSPFAVATTASTAARRDETWIFGHRRRGAGPPRRVPRPPATGRGRGEVPGIRRRRRSARRRRCVGSPLIAMEMTQTSLAGPGSNAPIRARATSENGNHRAPIPRLARSWPGSRRPPRRRSCVRPRTGPCRRGARSRATGVGRGASGSAFASASPRRSSRSAIPR